MTRADATLKFNDSVKPTTEQLKLPQSFVVVILIYVPNIGKYIRLSAAANISLLHPSASRPGSQKSINRIEAHYSHKKLILKNDNSPIIIATFSGKVKPPCVKGTDSGDKSVAQISRPSARNAY
jgi:hypothetical protein